MPIGPQEGTGGFLESTRAPVASTPDRARGDQTPQRLFVSDACAVGKGCGYEPPPAVAEEVLTRLDKGSLRSEAVLAVSIRSAVVAFDDPFHLPSLVPASAGEYTRVGGQQNASSRIGRTCPRAGRGFAGLQYLPPHVAKTRLIKTDTLARELRGQRSRLDDGPGPGAFSNPNMWPPGTTLGAVGRYVPGSIS